MKPINWILAGAAIPSVFVLGWMLLDTACTPEAAAAADESVRECYRSWIGSLSGWVAAAAAVITIFVLLLQIRRNEETAHRQQLEAREAFDHEIADTLRIINGVWKHAEDIYRAYKSDPRVLQYEKSMRIRLKAVKEHVDKKSLQDLCAQMHPMDAAKRKKLISDILQAIEEPKLPIVNPTQDQIHLLEANGPMFFEVLIINFLMLTHRLETISERFPTIFSNRDTAAQSAVSDNEDEDFFKLYFRDFPNASDNPY